MRPPWWMGVTDVVEAFEAHHDIVRMKGAGEGLVGDGDGLDSDAFVEALRVGEITAFAVDAEVDDIDFRASVDPQIAAGFAARISMPEQLESYLRGQLDGVDAESDEANPIADLLAAGSLLLDRRGLAQVARSVFGVKLSGGRPQDPDKDLYLTKFLRGDFETKAEADRWLHTRRLERNEATSMESLGRTTRGWRNSDPRF